MLAFLRGAFDSLWPKRYRPGTEVSPGSAIASGLIQLLVCLTGFIYRYFVFIGLDLFGARRTALHAVEVGGSSTGMPADVLLAGTGVLVLMEYLIQPLSLVLIYFTFEGLLRAVAAFITGEIVPMMPLVLVAWVHGKIGDAKAERALGERIPDLVEPVESPDIKLCIRSCRPKESWNHLMTVFYKDEMYEIAEEAPGNFPHQFIYLLRRKPDHKVVRGTHHYDPNEVLLNQ